MPLKFPYWTGSTLVEAESLYAKRLAVTCGGEQHVLLIVKRSDLATYRTGFIEGMKRRDIPLSSEAAVDLVDQMLLSPRLQIYSNNGGVQLGQRLPRQKGILSQSERHEFWASLIEQYIWQLYGPAFVGAGYDSPNISYLGFRELCAIFPGIDPSNTGFFGLTFSMATFGAIYKTIDAHYATSFLAASPMAIAPTPWANTLTLAMLGFIVGQPGSPDHYVASVGLGHTVMIPIPDLLPYGVMICFRPSTSAPSLYVQASAPAIGYNSGGIMTTGITASKFNQLEVVLIHPQDAPVTPGSQLVSAAVRITDVVVPASGASYAALFDDGRRLLLGTNGLSLSALHPSQRLTTPPGITQASWIEALTRGSTFTPDLLPAINIAGPVTDLQLGLGVGNVIPSRAALVLGDMSSLVDDHVVLSRWGGAERWAVDVQNASWDSVTRTVSVSGQSITIVYDTAGPTLERGMALRGYVLSGTKTALSLTLTDKTIATQAADTELGVWSLAEAHNNAALAGLLLDNDPSNSEIIDGIKLHECALRARAGLQLFARSIKSMPIVSREPLPAIMADGCWSVKNVGGAYFFVEHDSAGGVVGQTYLPTTLGTLLTWHYTHLQGGRLDGVCGTRFLLEIETVLADLDDSLGLAPASVHRLYRPWLASEEHHFDWRVAEMFKIPTFTTDPRLCHTVDDSKKVLYLACALRDVTPPLSALWEVARATAYELVSYSDSQPLLRLNNTADPLIARAASGAKARGYSSADDKLIAKYSRGYSGYLH